MMGASATSRGLARSAIPTLGADAMVVGGDGGHEAQSQKDADDNACHAASLGFVGVRRRELGRETAEVANGVPMSAARGYTRSRSALCGFPAGGVLRCLASERDAVIPFAMIVLTKADGVGRLYGFAVRTTTADALPNSCCSGVRTVDIPGCVSISDIPPFASAASQYSSQAPF